MNEKVLEKYINDNNVDTCDFVGVWNLALALAIEATEEPETYQYLENNQVVSR